MTTISTSPNDVEKNFSWNFKVNLIDAIFIVFGLGVISRETVLPLLVSQLTDSRVAIGMVAAIYNFGYYLPQLLTANYTEGLRRKKPFVMLLGGLGERGPYYLMGLVVLCLAVDFPGLTLTLIFLLLAISAASNGVATPAWYDMIAKVIPVQKRGLFSGVGHGLGALLAATLGAALVAKVLKDWSFPNNFAFLFGVAAIAVTISWVGLALTREPDSERVKESVPLIRYLKYLPNTLRKDSNFSHFVLSYSLVKVGWMAMGFFLVYGVERFGLTGTQIGIFTGVLIGSQAVLNLIWGLIADRIGHKIVLVGAAFALALAALVTLIAPSSTWLGLTFILLGAALAGDDVSRFNIVLEFCAPEDRPTYIGLTNTLLAPVTFLAPLLGGLLAEWLGYSGLFVITAFVALGGGLVFMTWVREPRQIRSKIQQS